MRTTANLKRPSVKGLGWDAIFLLIFKPKKRRGKMKKIARIIPVFLLFCFYPLSGRSHQKILKEKPLTRFKELWTEIPLFC